MPINADKPHLWKADTRASVEQFNIGTLHSLCDQLLAEYDLPYMEAGAQVIESGDSGADCQELPFCAGVSVSICRSTTEHLL